MMSTSCLIIDKQTRKKFRLQTAEKYRITRLNSHSFQVVTRDGQMTAFVDTLGVIISAKDDQTYDKVTLYKLQNFCSLLLQTHFDITLNWK